MVLFPGCKHPISHTLFQILLNYEEGDQKDLMIEFIQFSIDSYLNQIKGHTSSEVLEGFNNHIDEILDEKRKEGKLEVSCKKGCNHCCSINVDIYEQEAVRILSYLGEQGMYKQIDWNQIEGQVGLQLDTRWMSKYRRCAFLSEDGDCGIYPVRPINCKKFFVVSPSSDCDTSKGIGGSIQIQTIIEIEIIASVLDLVMRKGLMQDLLIEKRK